MRVLSIGFLFLLLTSALMAQSEKSIEKTIFVNATSKMNVAPDEAVIRLHINEKAKTFDEAASQLNKVVADVKELLEKEKVDMNEVKTKNYNISKNYRYHNGKQMEDGFIGNTYIEATIPLDTDHLSDIIKRFAKESPGLNLNFGFEVSDELLETSKEKLLIDAITRARSKANAIAGALGKKIMDIKTVQFSESTNNHYPRYAQYNQMEMMEDAVHAKAGAPVIENVDEVEVSLSVQTTWLLD